MWRRRFSIPKGREESGGTFGVGEDATTQCVAGGRQRRKAIDEEIQISDRTYQRGGERRIDFPTQECGLEEILRFLCGEEREQLYRSNACRGARRSVFKSVRGFGGEGIPTWVGRKAAPVATGPSETLAQIREQGNHGRVRLFSGKFFADGDKEGCIAAASDHAGELGAESGWCVRRRLPRCGEVGGCAERIQNGCLHPGITGVSGDLFEERGL